jgi:hypothetical protein
VYQTTFLDFKYEPLNFVFVEIRASNRVLIKPFMVQPVAITKLVNPLRDGIGLKIIPLPTQTFTILVQVTVVTIELVKGSEKSIKE